MSASMRPHTGPAMMWASSTSRYSPEKRGVRFSTKAAVPSR